jgi:hypothetical protein
MHRRRVLEDGEVLMLVLCGVRIRAAYRLRRLYRYARVSFELQRDDFSLTLGSGLFFSVSNFLRYHMPLPFYNRSPRCCWLC